MACLCKCGRHIDCGGVICDLCDLDLHQDENGNPVIVIYEEDMEEGHA